MRQIIKTIIIMILGLLLWSSLGASDTAASKVAYPFFESAQKITGEVIINGEIYYVVETTRVTTHLRTKF